MGRDGPSGEGGKELKLAHRRARALGAPSEAAVNDADDDGLGDELARDLRPQGEHRRPAIVEKNVLRAVADGGHGFEAEGEGLLISVDAHVAAVNLADQEVRDGECDDEEKVGRKEDEECAGRGRVHQRVKQVPGVPEKRREGTYSVSGCVH